MVEVMGQVRGVGAEEVGRGVPWEWFDFLEEPREVKGGIPTVEEGGAGRVWKVMVEGREVGFKVLRCGAGGGGRPVVILLAGMGLTVATFRGVSGELLKTHDVAVVDYSALLWEGSGWRRGGVAVRGMAKAVWGVADALGVERVSLGGSSLGGAMCLVAALERPGRVERMVLSNPACYPQELPGMYRLARVRVLGELMMVFMPAEKLVDGVEMIGYVDKRRFARELRRRYLRCLGRMRNRFRLMEMIRHLPGGAGEMELAEHVGRLKELRMPVLVSWGEQDPLLEAGSGLRLARELGNAVYRGYGDLAHMPHEEAPGVVGREWGAFLRGKSE